MIYWWVNRPSLEFGNIIFVWIMFPVEGLIGQVIPHTFWFKIWNRQWSNRFCVRDDESLLELVVGVVPSDLSGRKGGLWSQRSRVFGWEAGLCTVALWIARPKRLWPWRGSASTLALAASLAASQPWVPSIWSHQHYQPHHQLHDQHHNRYHHQHHNRYSLPCEPNFCGKPNICWIFRWCKHNGVAESRCGASCRLLRYGRCGLGDCWSRVLRRPNSQRAFDCLLGNSQHAISGTWRCPEHRKFGFLGKEYLSSSSGDRGLESHFRSCARNCRVEGR